MHKATPPKRKNIPGFPGFHQTCPQCSVSLAMCAPILKAIQLSYTCSSHISFLYRQCTHLKTCVFLSMVSQSLPLPNQCNPSLSCKISMPLLNIMRKTVSQPMKRKPPSHIILRKLLQETKSNVQRMKCNRSPLKRKKDIAHPRSIEITLLG